MNKDYVRKYYEEKEKNETLQEMVKILNGLLHEKDKMIVKLKEQLNIEKFIKTIDN